MKYHFRAGRGKNIIVDGDTTFEELGYEILGGIWYCVRSSVYV